jgi:hypothetical protein
VIPSGDGIETWNCKDRLILQLFEQWVAQVFQKEAFDQLVHRAPAATMRERNAFVSDLVFSTTSALDALEQWRWCEFFNHE